MLADLLPLSNGIYKSVSRRHFLRNLRREDVSLYLGSSSHPEAISSTLNSAVSTRCKSVAITLGTKLCQNVLVPWNASDRLPADIESRASALFSQRGYDDPAARIIFEPPTWGNSTLACWLDARTAAHIESLTRSKGISVTSVTSLLVAVANRFRKSIRKEDLLIIVEPDHISAFSRGRQASFLLSRASHEPAQLIPELVTRWQLEQSPAEADRIHVFAPLVPVLPELPGMSLQRLHIALPAGADPQLAFCLPAGLAAKR